jgi:ferredoxin
MSFSSLALIYFSPTHGTQKILEAVAQGMPVDKVEQVNLTLPEAEGRPPGLIGSDIAILGVPVYAGRVPLVATERLRQLKAPGTPALIVVVYGNREFEDALLELKNLAVEQGFRPLAGAAFIAEHSFSTQSTPLSVGRPDAADLEKARLFGQKAFEKLKNPNGDSTNLVEVPGNVPHRERMVRPDEAPVTLKDLCVLCGTCASVCPVAAVMVKEAVETKAGACIICQACVKNCPTGARIMEVERVRQVAQWLYTNTRQRKEPEVFL